VVPGRGCMIRRFALLLQVGSVYTNILLQRLGFMLNKGRHSRNSDGKGQALKVNGSGAD
jgi:hypothetical protein